MRKLFKLFNHIRKKDSGQGMVEYGLILALVSIVSIATLGVLGDGIKGSFEKVADSFDFVEVVEKHTVTFIDFDGEVLDSVKVVDGGSALAPEAPAVDGYTFIGWEGEFTDVSEDVTISSKYEENPYTITFQDVNGKLIGVDSVSPGGDAKVPSKLKLNATEDMWDQPLDNIQSDGVITLSYAIIETADELNNVRNNLDGKYIQVADIDLSGIDNFEPIGEYDSTFAGNREFTGIYDGGGYVISNLTIDKGSEYNAGLFGRAIGATFKNIGLVNVDVTGGVYTGGLVGDQDSSSVSNSYATGTVTGGDDTGGLVGYQSGSSTVTNSYATVSVTGGDNTGGLVGSQWLSSVSNSYATGSVTSTENNVGGLVGGQYDRSIVSNSYATGSATGRNYVGGLVGRQAGSSVSNSYATGRVNGYGYLVGGLVGFQQQSSVTDSYYDTETTKQSDTGQGTGKTTAQMKNKDTYMDWDNTIWEFKDGQYPTLR